MDHIKDIDISKRCGIKPENTVYNFLEEISDKNFQKKMREVISWKESSNKNIAKIGEESEKEYKPYLNSKIKDIPEKVLNRYTRNWYTDGQKYYIYQPCCM
jgi:hypothetical protein